MTCADHPPGMAGPICERASWGHVCGHGSCWSLQPCPADRLTEDDYRELARLIRRTHARAAARRARLAAEAEQPNSPPASG